MYAGKAGSELILDKKTSFDLDLIGHEWAAIRATFAAALKRAIESYAATWHSLLAIRKYHCRGFRIHKYPPGGFFDWHIDAYDASVAMRILSCVWYLNTVDNGGETEFRYQAVTIRPTRGKLLLFPSGFEYLHRSSPTVDSAKYVLVTFVEHTEGRD